MSDSGRSKAKRLTILSVSNIPLWTLGHQGGMPSIYWGQKGFVLAGHEVHFVVPGPEQHEELVEDGIHVHYFKIPFKPVSARYLWLHRISVKIYWLTFLVSAVRATMTIARQVTPDVVYGHALGAPAAWFVARRLGIKNITRLYGTFLLPCLSSSLRLLGKCEELLAFKIPSSYLIITDDGTGGREVARQLGVPDERVRFWRNGVNRYSDPNFDVPAFKKSVGISPNQRVILTASRLAEWKRVDRMITAVPEVVSQLDDVVFVILGEGPERARLEKLAESLGVAGNVLFMGAVPQHDVGKFMNAADLFVSLFDLSNVSNAVQEAMACGKCVLALDTGDTSKLITHEETGILIGLNDLPRLPVIFKDLLRDAPLRKRLGNGAMQFADEHMPSWETRARVEVDLIEKLLEQNSDRVLDPEEDVRTLVA